MINPDTIKRNLLERTGDLAEAVSNLEDADLAKDLSGTLEAQRNEIHELFDGAAMLPIGKIYSEKGNSMFVTDDDSRAVVIKLGHDLWLEIDDTVGDYPRLFIRAVRRTYDEQVARVQKEYAGRRVVRCNLNIVTSETDDGTFVAEAL